MKKSTKDILSIILNFVFVLAFFGVLFISFKGINFFIDLSIFDVISCWLLFNIWLNTCKESEV